jgi:sugar lactone lactonase YvrE
MTTVVQGLLFANFVSLVAVLTGMAPAAFASGQVQAKNAAASTSLVTRANAQGVLPPGSSTFKEKGDEKKHALEVVGTFHDMMPRGVAVSNSGRIFVCFPRSDSSGSYTLGELKNGEVTAYPNLDLNKGDRTDAKNSFVSILSAVIDDKNRLWVLDSGRIGKELVPGAPKLLAIDLETGSVVKNLAFPADVFLPTTVLKDLRITPRIGRDGTAIICDSSATGKSALIVVDLESGKCMRRLNGHPTVESEANFVIFAEGEMVRLRDLEGKDRSWSAGVTGLALSSDGSLLYYSPMAGLSLSSVSVPALCDGAVGEAAVEKTVKVIAREIGTSDGLESDSQNRLYLTDVENNEIWQLDTDGSMSNLVRDDRLIWPDRLCLAPNGYLYVIASQFNRSPWFHFGQDLRTKPFQLFRIKVDAKPVHLQ